MNIDNQYVKKDKSKLIINMRKIKYVILSSLLFYIIVIIIVQLYDSYNIFFTFIFLRLSNL